jgi:hypothetical protein
METFTDVVIDVLGDRRFLTAKMIGNSGMMYDLYQFIIKCLEKMERESEISGRFTGRTRLDAIPGSAGQLISRDGNVGVCVLLQGGNRYDQNPAGCKGIAPGPAGKPHFYAGDGPEVMMQACLQIMASANRKKRFAEEEFIA